MCGSGQKYLIFYDLREIFMNSGIEDFCKKRGKYKIGCCFVFLGIILVLFDQIIKLCIENSMDLNESFVAVLGILRITYLQHKIIVR